jgi:hypothetical protein
MDDPEPLVRLVDEGRLGQSSEARERERLLQRMAQDNASLAGTLLDLAERQSVVSVRTDAGRAHHGVVVAVGADFFVLRSDQGLRTHLRTAVVTTVRPHRHERHAPASGDRPPPLNLLLGEVLADVAGDRPRVTIVTRGAEVVSGELAAAGTDLLTVRLDGDARSLCYVAIAGIGEVGLEPA